MNKVNQLINNVPEPSQALRLAAIGDLLLTTKPGAKKPGRGLEALSAELRNLLKSCDIVLANLECTLPGSKTIDSEPRVFTTEAQLQTLIDAGINVVTLGNNHTFDAFDAGFKNITDILDRLNIQWCGAGYNHEEACKPIIIETNGVRVAIIGIVDASSGMNRFAGDTGSGVAPFNINQLCDQIKALHPKVDHIIISPHWGDERFRFPAPLHIKQAHALVEAGADLILGHHPHVLQGMENYRKATIVYSLGNFFANHVYWNNGDFLTWNRFERTGCVLLAELDKTGIRNQQQIPIFDNGTTIDIEKSGHGERTLQKINLFLNQGITPARYQQETFRVRTIKPILNHLNWNKLRRIRPGHLHKALHLFSQGMK